MPNEDKIPAMHPDEVFEEILALVKKRGYGIHINSSIVLVRTDLKNYTQCSYSYVSLDSNKSNLKD